MSSWWDALTNKNKPTPPNTQNTQNIQTNQPYNPPPQFTNPQNYPPSYQQPTPQYSSQYGYRNINNQYQNTNANQQYAQYGQNPQTYNSPNTNSQIKNLYPNLPDWIQPYDQYDYGSKIKYNQQQQTMNTNINTNVNTNAYSNNTTYSNPNTDSYSNMNTYATNLVDTNNANNNTVINYNEQANFNPLDALTVHALGWQLDQSTTEQFGQTKFVEEIGMQTLRNHKAFLGQTKNSGNVNPNDMWGMAAKGIQGQSVNYSPQNFNIYNHVGNNVTNVILQTAPNFQVNPTFLLNQTINKNNFPMPFVKYKIIPALDEKKALDVTSVNDEKKGFKKNNLIIWDYHGGPNQHFFINKGNDGKCFIINIARGFAVKVPNTVPTGDKKEVNIVAGPKLNAPNQKWELREFKGGSYQIISAKTGKALDLYYERCDNGTAVIEWECKDTRNQLWRIVPA